MSHTLHYSHIASIMSAIEDRSPSGDSNTAGNAADDAERPLCQQFYIEQGNKKTVLVAMMYGLVDHAIDVDSAPWNRLNRRLIKPSLTELKAEIRRRVPLVLTESDESSVIP